MADALLGLAALRVTLSRDEAASPQRKAVVVERFRAEVLQRARAAVRELLEVHAFGAEDADLTMLPWLDGRWAADLFHPETLRDAGVRLGKGAAIGAGIGLAADVALAGVSLGSAAALGAAVGGAASQGFGALGRRLIHLAQGREELSLEDSVVMVVAQRLVVLQQALDARGHAATDRIDLDRAAHADRAAAAVAARAAAGAGASGMGRDEARRGARPRHARRSPSCARSAEGRPASAFLRRAVGRYGRASAPCSQAPAARPASTHSICRLPVPSAAIAGPGHTPLRPQPTPNSAEPTKVSRCMRAVCASKRPPSSGVRRQRGTSW